MAANTPSPEGAETPPAGAPPAAPVVTNHNVTNLREEVELNVQSVEHLGSMLELHPSSLDPSYKYRWVNRDPKKIMRAKARGYEFVRVSDHRKVVNVVGDSPDTTAEGFYSVGDVVLMRSRKSTYQGRRKQLREKTEAKLSTGKKEFHRLAKREGKKRRSKIVVTGKFRQRNEPNERNR